jgi:hypothetical protein
MKGVKSLKSVKSGMGSMPLIGLSISISSEGKEKRKDKAK